ncbi:MAG: DUF2304 domain-containing protein [Ornithinibacter sp.]
MQWIKIPLVLAAVGVLIFLVRQRRRVEMRAGVRVVALVLFLAAVVSIIEPDIPQRAAELVGVTRGTDLMLYVLVVVYALTTLGLYFRVREGDQRLRRLARDLALERAERDAPWARGLPSAPVHDEGVDESTTPSVEPPATILDDDRSRAG